MVFVFNISKQLQLWLQKDDYINSNPDRPLGEVCVYPVHSKNQRLLLDSYSSSPDRELSGHPMSEICVTGSALELSKNSGSANRTESVVPPAASFAEPKSRPLICMNNEKEADSGCVRSILNILDSFNLEDLKEDKSKKAISVVESRVTDGPAKEPLKEKKGAFNEESLVGGLSQGDRLQQIKSMRRHARSTTTGALKSVFQF